MSKRSCRRRKGAVAAAAAVGVTLSGAAVATPIEVEGWSGNWNTTLSVGTTWRAQDANSKLFKAADGNSIGNTGGTGGTGSDSNTLNSEAGDRVSTIFKMVSDIELKKDEMGGVLRFKAWYDEVPSNEGHAYGNMANGYHRGASLSDSDFGNAQKFKGASLLDAYVYKTFDVADRPLQIRLGRQVMNWGESLFFQGINQVNPLDLPALRRPGAEIKEALVPVWAANANVGLGAGFSMEGFFQFVWEPTAVEGCGTYWSSMDISVGAKPGRCNKITVGSKSTAAAIATGNYAPLVQGHEGSNFGEFGLAVRKTVDPIDTEFGLYGMNIHARTPVITGRTGSWGSIVNNNALRNALGGTLNPLWAAQANQTAVGANGVTAASAFWEYPEDVQVFGASAATTLFGWSVGSEVSVTPNLPVQRNANDLLNAMLTGRGPLGTMVSSTAALSDVSGYDRFTRTQFQINGVKTFGGILGSAKSTAAGEAAFQWVDVPDYRSGNVTRYGRAFVFGTATSTGNDTCVSGSQNNPQRDGCQNDGFVTPFSWGYRLRGSLEYPQIFDTAVTFIPSVYFAHDVNGVSADGQLNEGRMTMGLGARFNFMQNYNLDMNYVTYYDNAKFDPLRDHDFYSLSISASF